ncbi:MAG: aspartate--tRNA ligase [Acidimicrobiales bacterium]
MNQVDKQEIPRAAGLRSHYIGALDTSLAGSKVAICGWVSRIREQGKQLIFIDVRDFTGIVQCVLPLREDIRSETVVRVRATVSLRPEGTENPQLSTGTLELTECELDILGSSEPVPFPVSERLEVDETTRLRYRYVDIRRSAMQRNLRLRAKVNSAIRRSMEANGFLEVETPLLWTPTPEGAREFVVPSRLQQGSAYVLPQSPQIAKQLLMVGGVDRYYQIARCLRDEDLRADRQFEFTQLDLEASFVTQDDVMTFISSAIAETVRAARGIELESIPSITWKEAMDQFGSDKPDRRFGHPLIDATDIFVETSVRALSATSIKALVAPEPDTLTRSRLDQLVERAKSLGAKGLLWLRVVEEAGVRRLDSPVAKFLTEQETARLIERCEANPGDVILMVADEWQRAVEVLGAIRLDLGRHLASSDQLDFFWVRDFPLFEGYDGDGKLLSAHHPFTMPNEEDFALLDEDPIRVRSQSYDLVVNGWELGSGSIRIHRHDIQAKIFGVLGIDKETARTRFGFLLDAFTYGAPPHGGFAFGIDRLVAILAGEDNIREVIAFPKTQSGSDPMTGAPKPLDNGVWRTIGVLPLSPKTSG